MNLVSTMPTDPAARFVGVVILAIIPLRVDGSSKLECNPACVGPGAVRV
jgi:hypothetical protein